MKIAIRNQHNQSVFFSHLAHPIHLDSASCTTHPQRLPLQTCTKTKTSRLCEYEKSTYSIRSSEQGPETLRKKTPVGKIQKLKNLRKSGRNCPYFQATGRFCVVFCAENEEFTMAKCERDPYLSAIHTEPSTIHHDMRRWHQEKTQNICKTCIYIYMYILGSAPSL